MGTISLLLPVDLPPDRATELERASVAGGPDNMPWPTEVHVERGRMTVHRGVDESGSLVVPWDIAGLGRLMGNTATLMERPTPYHLQLELARGKVNQVRSQLADWRAGGLQVSADLEQLVRAASNAFGQAVIQTDPEQIGAHAESALTLAYQAAQSLVQAYVAQVYSIRHQRQAQLDTGLACRLGASVPTTGAALIAPTFNAVTLPLSWSDVEPAEGDFHWDQQDALLAWAQGQKLEVAAGPLVDFCPGRLPPWLGKWQRDLANLARLMGRYIESAVQRYRDSVRRWQLTSAGNWGTVLGLSEDELLWLTVRLAEAAKQVDPGLELSVGIAQPWGEYMAVQERTHSPFIFADTLIRSGLNLASLDLELVMGVSPRGSYCRDLLETSRLLDLYALLGTPLRITLGYPAQSSPESSADPSFCTDAGFWKEGYTASAQADWAEAFATLAVSKPYVLAVQWAHLTDSEQHQFPHLGLVEANGTPRPALDRLRELRRKHLR